MSLFHNPLLSPDPIDRSSTRSITPSTSSDSTITSAASDLTATPPSAARLTSRQQQLLSDPRWTPDLLERIIAFPRTYALAQPDKYPITHRLHQQLMALSARSVKAGPEGVDFTDPNIASTVTPEELGMIYVCRTYGVDPVRYMQAVHSKDCQRVADLIYARDPTAWDKWLEIYERRKFCINPQSYAQIAYALTGPFRKQYDAVANAKAASTSQ
ncbi:hypothetical protein L226DRAFT_617023 [Lentinus tigrinus ALCF2SS1-7]|uniref:uncharacterized protein n=1 Tax=Lentinus tigrinus ALCF2SS1-7 TaxID=1328758 RepID=UPI0011662D76|nr:hypothetical protein L226DRAFT_617023 [Lentinus tigrinus ALCF2SS1-7]